MPEHVVNVFVSIMQDRHVDVGVSVFATLEDARAECAEHMRTFCSSHGKWSEQQASPDVNRQDGVVLRYECDYEEGPYAHIELQTLVVPAT